MKINLYSDITFNEFIDNCEVLRDQFDGLLSPFFDVEAIKSWKTMIYSLKFPYSKCDLIWEFLNGDVELEELQKNVKCNN